MLVSLYIFLIHKNYVIVLDLVNKEKKCLQSTVLDPNDFSIYE